MNKKVEPINKGKTFLFAKPKNKAAKKEAKYILIPPSNAVGLLCQRSDRG